MKKLYQQPTTHVITLNTMSMVCGSVNSVWGIDDLGVDNNGTEDAGITTGAARQSTVWDDDEEEF